jgi:hypothetical protein
MERATSKPLTVAMGHEPTSHRVNPSKKFLFPAPCFTFHRRPFPSQGLHKPFYSNGSKKGQSALLRRRSPRQGSASPGRGHAPCCLPSMATSGQNEPRHSLRRHGRSTSVSGPAGPAVGTSGSGHTRKPNFVASKAELTSFAAAGRHGPHSGRRALGRTAGPRSPDARASGRHLRLGPRGDI